MWGHCKGGPVERRPTIANEAIKSQLLAEGGSSKSRVGGAPKRQTIGSPQAGEFDSADAVYLPRSESESEDKEICMVSDDEGLDAWPFQQDLHK